MEKEEFIYSFFLYANGGINVYKYDKNYHLLLDTLNFIFVDGNDIKSYIKDVENKL
jgi:hypothetical protein